MDVLIVVEMMRRLLPSVVGDLFVEVGWRWVWNG